MEERAAIVLLIFPFADHMAPPAFLALPARERPDVASIPRPRCGFKKRYLGEPGGVARRRQSRCATTGEEPRNGVARHTRTTDEDELAQQSNIADAEVMRESNAVDYAAERQ